MPLLAELMLLRSRLPGELALGDELLPTQYLLVCVDGAARDWTGAWQIEDGARA